MKPLTVSQQQHLIALIERAKAAQATINQFVEYLRDEHSAPEAAGWQLLDVQTGFVQTGPKPEPYPLPGGDNQ